MVVDFASFAYFYIYNNCNYLAVVNHFREKKTPKRKIRMV